MRSFIKKTIGILILLLFCAICRAEEVTVYDYDKGGHKNYSVQQTGGSVDVCDYGTGTYKSYDVIDDDWGGPVHFRDDPDREPDVTDDEE